MNGLSAGSGWIGCRECSQPTVTPPSMTSSGGFRLAPTHDGARMGLVDAHHVSPSTQGPVMPDPRLPDSRLWLLNPVITRGTPPRVEGCRPASRGLTLALMTDTKTSLLRGLDANSGGDFVPLANLRRRPACDRALQFS